MLNHLKLLAAEKMDLEIEAANWNPIFLQKGDQYMPAYIIEENYEWITVAIAKGPTTEPGEIMIIKKSSVRYNEVTIKQMNDLNKQFGKVDLSMISNG